MSLVLCEVAHMSRIGRCSTRTILGAANRLLLLHIPKMSHNYSPGPLGFGDLRDCLQYSAALKLNRTSYFTESRPYRPGHR